jgi:hypothetical protein
LKLGDKNHRAVVFILTVSPVAATGMDGLLKDKPWLSILEFPNGALPCGRSGSFDFT